MRNIAVFLVNGFIESGKTKLISNIVCNDGFYKKGSTLILTYEEGIEEYDERKLQDHNTLVVKLDSDQLNYQTLEYYADLYDTDRIVIEMNQMIDKSSLIYPSHFMIQQVITLIDATTFNIYFNNMRQKFADMVKESDLVIFNRCESMEVLSGYRRSILAINQDVDVIFEDINGKVIETLPEDLPYDLNNDTIEINDEDYGIWYFDCNDNVTRYLNKHITIKGFTLVSDELPKNHFIIGRLAMTCCEDDISLLGLEVVNNMGLEVVEKEWLKIKCTIKNEYSLAMQEVGPVLYVEEIEKVEAIKDQVIKF